MNNGMILLPALFPLPRVRGAVALRHRHESEIVIGIILESE